MSQLCDGCPLRTRPKGDGSSWLRNILLPKRGDQDRLHRIADQLELSEDQLPQIKELLKSIVFCSAEGWQPFDVQKIHEMAKTALERLEKIDDGS